MTEIVMSNFVKKKKSFESIEQIRELKQADTNDLQSIKIQYISILKMMQIQRQNECVIPNFKFVSNRNQSFE